MLLFSSDTFTLNGITVFRDHADKNQFWFLPGPVGLEVEAADSKEPQFLLILYAPDVASTGVQGTGFLNVTLCLTVSADVQSQIIGKIRAEYDDADDPHLSPVPFDDGTVQIVALDMQGNDTTSGAAGQAVNKILGTSNPELFGNNDALFALTLSEEGATILEQAFLDGMTPVGGIYNLKFTGVLPELSVKITADYKKMYTSFEASLAGKAYIASVGLDAKFEQLKQDGVIKVDVVNLSTTNDVATDEAWALALFKDQIMSQWFTPSLSPTGAPTTPVKGGGGSPPVTGGGTPPPIGGGGGLGGGTLPGGGGMITPPPVIGAGGAGIPPTMGGGSGGIRPMINLAHDTTPAPTVTPAPVTPNPTAPVPTPTPNPLGGGAGGAGGVAKGVGKTASDAASAASPFGISLQLKYLSQEEFKTVEIDFNEMKAVQRTYSPQGYFGLLLQGVDQSKHFLKVDGTDPFFNKFAVTVNAPKDFAGIGLTEAHTALDYGLGTANPKHGEMLFDPTKPPQQIWDVFEGQIQQTSYTYTPDYHFDAESGWFGETLSYQLPATTTENRVLTLDPYDFLGFLQLAITANRINADLVDRIEVPLTYTAASGWQQSTTIVVRPGNAPQTWKIRRATREIPPDLYSYSTNCYLKDGTLIATPVQSSNSTAILVNDPFIGALNLVLQPAFDGTAFSMAIVEINYADPAVNYSFQTIVQLQANSPAAKIHIPLVHRETNQFQYRISLITTANAKVQGDYVTAQDQLVLVTKP